MLVTFSQEYRSSLILKKFSLDYSYNNEKLWINQMLPKIFVYIKDLFESKYQLLINRTEKKGSKL